MLELRHKGIVFVYSDDQETAFIQTWDRQPLGMPLGYLEKRRRHTVSGRLTCSPCQQIVSRFNSETEWWWGRKSGDV